LHFGLQSYARGKLLAVDAWAVVIGAAVGAAAAIGAGFLERGWRRKEANRREVVGAASDLLGSSYLMALECRIFAIRRAHSRPLPAPRLTEFVKLLTEHLIQVGRAHSRLSLVASVPIVERSNGVLDDCRSMSQLADTGPGDEWDQAFSRLGRSTFLLKNEIRAECGKVELPQPPETP
jgi:hypothetical protein